MSYRLASHKELQILPFISKKASQKAIDPFILTSLHSILNRAEGAKLRVCVRAGCGDEGAAAAAVARCAAGEQPAGLPATGADHLPAARPRLPCLQTQGKPQPCCFSD